MSQAPSPSPAVCLALPALVLALMAPPLAAQGPGTVLAEAKISDGGFTDGLDDGDAFGASIASLGDLDGDGVADLAVGAHLDDDGGADRGAVWVLFMNADGTVRAHQKISATEGGFNGPLDDGDQFGASVASLGDVDGDGVPDLAVGATLDDDGGADRGAVYLLYLRADGTVRAQRKLSSTAGGFGGALDDGDAFGSSIASLGDLDGDGVVDLAVGARLDDDGGTNRGAVWVLFLNANGTVRTQQKVSSTAGGFTGALDDSDFFGCAVAALGDLDGDGVPDLAVGANRDDDGGTNRGAVWALFMNADGTVRAHQKISDTAGGFTGVLDNGDLFGTALASPGDLDGDGAVDLVAGADLDDDGGESRGAVWVLFMNADGTVRAHQKISDSEGGFIGVLDDGDRFGWAVAAAGDLNGDGVADLAVGAPFDDAGGADRGAVWVLQVGAGGGVRAYRKVSSIDGRYGLEAGADFAVSVASLGDLDGDGIPDLAVGAPSDDDGGLNRGAAWVLFLNADGTVKAHQKISPTEGGFNGALDDDDLFGASVASPGDLDGDGIPDLAVGAPWDDDGGTDRGAVWVLFLNADGTVRAHQKVSSTEGGFTGALDISDEFGSSIASLGDLDGDGIPDITVGAPFDDDGGSNRGAVWGLFLNADGTVRAHQKISSTEGNFTGVLDDGDTFGWSVASLGDVDGDGVTDLAVGVPFDGDGGVGRGAVWVLRLDTLGRVRFVQKISDTLGLFDGVLDDSDNFGRSIASPGDLDGDGIPDLAVGAPSDDDGGSNRGAVWVLFLDPIGRVASYQKVSSTEGGFNGPLDNGDQFGSSIASLGDVDGDGVTDLAVGAPGDSDLGLFESRGAVWVLSLDGAGPPPPNYDLTVTPTGPLTVPPGGQLSFAYTVANNTASSVTGDLYFVARRSGNAVAQAVVRSGTLPGGQAIQGTMTLRVPGGAPQGAYALTFSIGRAFNQAVDSETFAVTVQGAALREGGEAWAVAEASPWSPATTTASATGAPTAFALHGASPNPSAGRATLRYDVPAPGPVRLAVYDVLGREVAVLVDVEVAAGQHAAALDASGLPSGVYVARLEAGGRSWTRRLTVLR